MEPVHSVLRRACLEGAVSHLPGAHTAPQTRPMLGCHHHRRCSDGSPPMWRRRQRPSRPRCSLHQLLPHGGGCPSCMPSSSPLPSECMHGPATPGQCLPAAVIGGRAAAAAAAPAAAARLGHVPRSRPARRPAPASRRVCSAIQPPSWSADWAESIMMQPSAC